MVAYDTILGSDGDLPIDIGPLQLGPSDNQHITDAMRAFPGWWKQFPQNGIGLPIFYKARVVPAVVLNRVKTQLMADRYTLIDPSVTVNNGVLEVIPNAIRT